MTRQMKEMSVALLDWKLRLRTLQCVQEFEDDGAKTSMTLLRVNLMVMEIFQKTLKITLKTEELKNGEELPSYM